MVILNINYPLLDQKPEKRLLFLNTIIDVIRSDHPIVLNKILTESDMNTFLKIINSAYKDVFIIDNYSLSKKGILDGEIVLGLDILFKDIQDKKLNPFNQIPSMENKDDSILLKRVDLTLNTLKNYILNPGFFNLWLFKYFDNMFIPYNNTGYTIYKAYFDEMKIDEVKTYFRSELIASEIRRLQKRESNNQISHTDCVHVIEFVNEFMETLDIRTKEYQADNIKKLISELTDGRYDSEEDTNNLTKDKILLLVDDQVKKGRVISHYKNAQVLFIDSNVITRSLGPRYLVVSQMLKKFDSANLIIVEPLKIVGIQEAKQLLEEGIDAGPSVDAVNEYLSKC
ncbi:hypothetical protein MCP_1600 [Methanocella paludicola SANAE]|uniref:Uncharacterized protein n=1 Tax=Methanocella paludicola (strain DSM 17711 / JCM 13418 / NBRC 101707 / SANAE) TaxID=304371 RepID=D1YZ00_METPS|nr:hypothetical protein [Methanocella paludicola]BAI61672.1 hypothetical protein MCP_1600 [Methanocella paludicola SANAE]